MAQLSLPTVRVRRSFLAAMAEFRGEGRGTAEDRTMIGNEIRELGDAWSATPDGFAHYVQALLAQAREDSPRPDGYVPSTTMWWVQDEDVRCERNGGVLEDQRGDKLRFWVPTS